MSAYRREDHETPSVEAAEMFERMHGDEPYDERPTLAECQRDEAEANGWKPGMWRDESDWNVGRGWST